MRGIGCSVTVVVMILGLEPDILDVLKGEEWDASEEM